MPTIQEYFLHRWDMEQPKFVAVMRAMPGDRLDYRPHEKSTAAGALAWQIVEEQRLLSEMIDSGKILWSMRPMPSTPDAIADAYETATNELRPRITNIDEATWNKEAQFLFGEHVVGTSTVGEFLWGFLFDMVHHRGQLSTYLRPMGGKVPSIYGPSADTQG